jgi:DNA-binding CsgD family transcriptional regulator
MSVAALTRELTSPAGLNGTGYTPRFILPENPCDGLLAPEDWVAVGATLGLTARELAVAVLIFEDRTRRSIGRRLRRSAGGTRKRIDKVFKKMNVKDKLGLVQRVWQVHNAIEARGHKDAPCRPKLAQYV